MTQDEIYEMVKKTELKFLLNENWMMHDELEAFAKLVAAKEREAIANVFQEMTKNGHPYMIRMTNAIATIIRARGEQE
jgi:hypothetical protein